MVTNVSVNFITPQHVLGHVCSVLAFANTYLHNAYLTFIILFCKLAGIYGAGFAQYMLYSQHKARMTLFQP